MIKVHKDRLARDLDSLSQFGKTAQGITRLAFSEEEKQARAWLVEIAEAAGLKVNTDLAGNIRIRLDAQAEGPAVACGSHIDTVKSGGHLDGALGVIAGVEALRRIREEQVDIQCPLEVIAFSDEEGRFGGMLGSRAIAGVITTDEVLKAQDVNGYALSDCLADHNLDPQFVVNAKEASGAFKAFVELHIEQGPVLENKNISIGVVESITGLFKWEIEYTGQANHAGTTPMDMRRDAFQATVDFAGQIQIILNQYGTENAKATIGKLSLKPGSPNVVPGVSTFTLEARDTNQTKLGDLKIAFEELLDSVSKKNDVDVKITKLSDIDATQCDAEIINVVEEAARALGYTYIKMPSGAAHDAQYMAKITPTTMIFVPSIGGISHNPLEDTHIDNIEQGANVLLNTLIECVC